jgi:tetratricopeptide (TPR) repeat protein
LSKTKGEIAKLVKELEKNPDDLKLLLKLGGAYLFTENPSLENFEKAKECFERVLDLDADNIEAHFQLGNIYYYQADYHKAIEYYTEVSLAEAFHYQAFFNLGNAYYVLRNFREAIYHYKQAFYIDPKNAEAYFSIALAHYYNNEIEKAKKMLLQYDELYSPIPKTYILLAKIYSLEKNTEKALIYLEKAITLDPTYRQIADDSEFDSIRETVAFQNLM